MGGEDVRGYAGVLVLCGDRVLLIRGHDYFAPERTSWSLPSGRIEPGESPDVAAARELAEEAGCHLDPGRLELAAMVAVRQQGRVLSHSWNYVAEVADEALTAIDDPDGDVVEAAWCDRGVAIERLAGFEYAPIREPALHLLRTGERGLAWEFEVVDDQPGTVPGFTWNTSVLDRDVR